MTSNHAPHSCRTRRATSITTRHSVMHRLARRLYACRDAAVTALVSLRRIPVLPSSSSRACLSISWHHRHRPSSSSPFGAPRTSVLAPALAPAPILVPVPVLPPRPGELIGGAISTVVPSVPSSAAASLQGWARNCPYSHCADREGGCQWHMGVWCPYSHCMGRVAAWRWARR